MKILITILLSSILFSASSADACSMAPFDPKKALAELNLERFALATFKVQPNSPSKVEMTEADGNYIWNNPMCPEGVWVSAVYSVTFPTDNSPSCTGVVKVTKRTAEEVNFRGKHIPAEDKVIIEKLQDSICLFNM